MNYVIHPLKGVGDIQFGMTPEEVRSRMKTDFKSFKRTPQVAFPSDYFPAANAFFYYDASGLLEGVEFGAPARPTVYGLDLMNLPFEQAVAKLAVFDKDTKVEVDGAISYHLGVGVWAPLAKEDRDAPVESVLAFRQGSYS